MQNPGDRIGRATDCDLPGDAAFCSCGHVELDPQDEIFCLFRTRRFITLGLRKRVVQSRISPVPVMVAIYRHLGDAIASHEFGFVCRRDSHFLSDLDER